MKTRNVLRKGFTLIELMVVILILGILAALIIPKLFGQQDKAKDAKARADIAELSNALDRFRADNDRYPTDSEGLNALLVAPSDTPNWKEPYILKLPQDPWQDEYQYKFLGNNQIEVRSYGPDRAPDTADDITNLDTTAPAQ